MQEHKNSIMMVISILFLVYALFLSVYPFFLSASFNRAEFEEKAYKASGLKTTVDDVEFKIMPNLTLITKISGWSSKYIDDQDCFDAGFIEIHSNPLAPVTKNFVIKNMYLKHVNFADQVLPSGENKLDYLPKSFEASAFNTKVVKITPGPVKVRDFTITFTDPDTYKEEKRRETVYSSDEVRKFLKDKNIRFVKVN